MSRYKRRQYSKRHVAISFHRRVRYHVLSLYLKFGHHLHPLCYLCAKFHFCRGLYCWASPWRKITTQWITHPAYLMPRNQSFHFGKYLLQLHSSDMQFTRRKQFSWVSDLIWFNFSHYSLHDTMPVYMYLKFSKFKRAIKH